MERLPEHNQVFLIGNIESDFQFDHSFFKYNYYRTTLAVDRKSGTLDHIPIVVSDRGLDLQMISGNARVRGSLRVYSDYRRTENKTKLFVHATELEAVNQDNKVCKGRNEIFLDGFICKEPVYRVTPLRREITDILVGVSRASKKIDYIPCICWGRCAQIAADYHSYFAY